MADSILRARELEPVEMERELGATDVLEVDDLFRLRGHAAGSAHQERDPEEMMEPALHAVIVAAMSRRA